MESDLENIQKALDQSEDALFEASRQRLPEDIAESVQSARNQLAQARASLVRLEADLLRAREELRGWTLIQDAISAPGGTQSV